MMTRPPSANAANRQTSPRHGLAPTLVCLALLLASAASGAVTGNWAVDADGTWNTPTNWSSNPSIPNAAGDTANLTYNIAASRTVTLDVPVTVGYLTMEDLTTVNADWILIGSNALTMDTGSAANATLTVSSRTLNRIDTDMVLNSPYLARSEAIARPPMPSTATTG